MLRERAQVATEYLIVTGFILAVVTVIFAYSYISNSETMKVNLANNALDRLVNKADLVYALGPDNVHFVDIAFPRGIQSIQDITICTDGYQQHYDDSEESCPEEHGRVLRGAIGVRLGLIGGTSTISRPARAEIELDGFEATGPGGTSESIEAVEGRQRVKVYWCGSKICLKRA